MMPEVETLPIFARGKKVASLVMIYGQSGWKAQLVTNTKPATSEVIASGEERLGPDAARTIANELANKWRDSQR